MIHTIIQIFVMALLFFAIFRESKRDRLNQMQQIDDIRKFFDLQAEYIARQAKQLNSAIDKQADRLSEIITEQAKYTCSLIKVKLEDDITPILDSIEGDIYTSHNDINSQLSTLNSQLASIEAPIKLWGEAQVKNEIKKGEANRTLRHKLQQNREYIKSMEQSLQVGSNRLSALSTELEQAKAAARDIVAETMKEISLIRSWMDKRGIPHATLDNHLSLEFKGNIPSQVYSRTKNEQALQESLSN